MLNKLDSPQGETHMKVKDIMVKEVATLDINDELSLANDIMRLGRIRHLPVVDGHRLVGIISERDLFRSSLAQALGYATKETRDLMKTLRIKDVMVGTVITIPPDTDVCEATKIMMEEKIGCLPVVEDNIMVGLITETDILMQYVKECGQG
jgi:CBS domain-containing protein